MDIDNIILSISEKDFFAWVASPLIAGLKGKSNKEIKDWLSESKIPPVRLTGIAQRAHILSISVLRASLGDAPVPPGFPENVSARFEKHVIAPFAEKQKWDETMRRQYIDCWRSECKTLQSKGALINFIALTQDDILDILEGHWPPGDASTLDQYFRRKMVELLGANSAIPFLLSENNLLMDGMLSLFSDGLERCSISYMCRSIPGEVSEAVNNRIWAYRRLLGVNQADAPTIPKLGKNESRRLRKLLGEGEPESELEIASILLPDSEIMMAVSDDDLQGEQIDYVPEDAENKGSPVFKPLVLDNVDNLDPSKKTQRIDIDDFHPLVYKLEDAKTSDPSVPNFESSETDSQSVAKTDRATREMDSQSDTKIAQGHKTDLQSGREIDSQSDTKIDRGHEKNKQEPQEPPSSDSAFSNSDMKMEDMNREMQNEEIIEQIGNYKILELVGSGGMGTVYKARSIENGQIVAIKKMHNPEESSEEDLKRFKQEAKLAIELEHPNIVKVYEAVVDGSTPYLVMQYVEGTLLSALINQEKISLRHGIEIIRDISMALDYAHAQGIIHRDIKPSNIMISNDGTPLLMDFGLAKDIFSKDADITKMGEVLGTPQYMSPEQARGRIRDLDGRSDIYSLGTVFYELMTGIAPVKGRTAVDVLYHVVNTEPVPPSKLNPRIPKEIEAVCLKAMEKDPNRRYQNASGMAEDIERYFRGEITGAVQNFRLSRRLKRWIKQNYKVFLPLFLTGLSILTCLATVLVLRNFSSSNIENVSDSQATSLIKQGNLQEAVSTLKERLDQNAVSMRLIQRISGSLAYENAQAFDRLIEEWSSLPPHEYLKIFISQEDEIVDIFCLLQLGFPSECMDLLNKVPSYLRMNGHYYFLKGQALLYMGNEKEGVEEIRKAGFRNLVFQNSRNPLLLYALSQWSLCQYSCDQVLKKRPEDINALLAQSLLYLKLKRYSDAARGFHKISALYPKIPGSYLYLGRCYEIPNYEKEMETAFKELEEFMKRDKGLIPFSVIYEYANLSLQISFHYPEVRQKILPISLSFIESLLKFRPISKNEYWAGMILKGQYYFLQDDVEKAYQIAREAFDNNRDDEKLCNLLANCLLQKASYEDGLNVLLYGLECHPDSGILRYATAKMYEKLNRPEAFSNYMRASWLLTDDPLYEKKWKDKFPSFSEKYYQSWQANKSIASARSMLSLPKYSKSANYPDWEYDGSFFETVLKKCLNLENKKKTEDAIVLLEEVMEKYPCMIHSIRSDIHQNLGRMYLSQNRKETALLHFQEAWKYNPVCIPAYKSLADFYISLFSQSKSSQDAVIAIANIDMILLLQKEDEQELQSWKKKKEDILSQTRQ